MIGVEHYRDLVRGLVDGRKVIVPGGVLANGGARARYLRELGATDVFLLAGSRGTGPQPSPEDAVGYDLGIGGSSMMANLRLTEAALLDLPEPALDAVDDFDPERKAVVLASPFTADDEIASRRVVGRRAPSWEALEDKVVCDTVFDAAGVDRAPSEVVDADAEALQTTSRHLDAGSGVVWSGDAREGFNGGAEYVRVIRGPADHEEAERFFAAHCDRVRVMPFLDGTPCSIHGFVHTGEVVAFRPVELLVLRRPTNRFLYAGTATFWDPDPAEREAMRETAGKVGAELDRRVGYRGGFTVDGVLTADGFRPTELNARFGAGTVPLTAALDLPLTLVNTLAISDPEADIRPADLERIIVEHADAHRAGGAYSVLPEAADGVGHGVVVDGDRLRRASEGEVADASFALGPSGVGGFIHYAPAPERTPVGPSFAPAAVRAFAYADEAFSTGFGPLESAPELRSSARPSP